MVKKKQRKRQRTDYTFIPVLQRKLRSICEEMALTLLRTTRSPILNEAQDFVTGIYDNEGRMLEQCEYAPILSFSLQPVCKYILRYFKGKIYPGDVIIHNDVFSEGNQLPDVAVFKPIFVNGEMVAWSACKGHQADIGGNVAGGYNAAATEVWQEGLRIPPLKIYEKGTLREDVWNLIFANVRYKVVEEDISAQIGGCAVGERRFLELVGAYGYDFIRHHLYALLDSTEKMMRKELSQIPNGTYPAETYVFYDGFNKGSRFKLKVTIEVKDGELFFDYTGTDPQTVGFVNAVANTSASAVIVGVLNLVNPYIPHNEGMLRPLHMHFPEGTFVNARFPAATTFSNHLADEHVEAIFKALSDVLPRKVTAAWNRIYNCIVTGFDPRKNKPYVDILFLALKGGGGAKYGVDGYDHIGLTGRGGKLLAQDPEIFEMSDPHFLMKYELATDTAGAGQWRGGFGVETVFRFYGTSTRGVIFGDGDEEGAFGLFGGKAGALNQVYIEKPDGTIYRPLSKEVIRDIPTGSIYHQISGGGGGYGDPRLRPLEWVVVDVRNGFVSLESAEKDYGVVFIAGTFQVDHERTRQLRGSG
jgi:N-methylhydantoinase B